METSFSHKIPRCFARSKAMHFTEKFTRNIILYHFEISPSLESSSLVKSLESGWLRCRELLWPVPSFAHTHLSVKVQGIVLRRLARLNLARYINKAQHKTLDNKSLNILHTNWVYRKLYILVLNNKLPSFPVTVMRYFPCYRVARFFYPTWFINF